LQPCIEHHKTIYFIALPPYLATYAATHAVTSTATHKATK